MNFNLDAGKKKIIALVSIGAVIIYALPWTRDIVGTWLDKPIFSGFPVIAAIAAVAAYGLFMVYDRQV